mmetsp:Transcript_34968/g.57832  ORF Transcript_34968/g.57832 Transcript_34968/m.57832 type:complete len:82 (+) Transcript_34968:83-328(+)
MLIISRIQQVHSTIPWSLDAGCSVRTPKESGSQTDSMDNMKYDRQKHNGDAKRERAGPSQPAFRNKGNELQPGFRWFWQFN